MNAVMGGSHKSEKIYVQSPPATSGGSGVGGRTTTESHHNNTQPVRVNAPHHIGVSSTATASTTAVFDLSRASTTTLPPSACGHLNRGPLCTSPPESTDVGHSLRGGALQEVGVASNKQSSSLLQESIKDVLSPPLAGSMPSKTFTDVPRSSSNDERDDDEMEGAAAEEENAPRSSRSSPLVTGIRTISPQIAEIDEQLVEAWVTLFDSMLTLDAAQRFSARAARRALKEIGSLYSQREDLVSAQYDVPYDGEGDDGGGPQFNGGDRSMMAESMQGANMSLFGYSSAVAPVVEVSPLELNTDPARCTE